MLRVDRSAVACVDLSAFKSAAFVMQCCILGESHQVLKVEIFVFSLGRRAKVFVLGFCRGLSKSRYLVFFLES